MRVIEKVECPYCNEFQNKEIYSETIKLQCICIECENEFEVYKTKENTYIYMPVNE